MTAEIHVDDVGTSFQATIKDENDENVNVATASELVMKFSKPSGTVLEKTASFVTDGSDALIKYVTGAGDLDEPGTWHVQGYVEMNGGAWHSNVHDFRVHRNLS